MNLLSFRPRNPRQALMELMGRRAAAQLLARLLLLL
jgi:hypothetical protein